MRKISVTTPEGVGWTVRVAWAPRWRALARRFGGWRAKRTGRSQDAAQGALEVGGNASPSGGGGSGGSGGSGGTGGLADEIVVVIVVAVVFVLGVAVFWWVLLPLLLVLLDALIVVVLLVVSVFARVLLRRPWTVEATAAGRPAVTVHVVGWRAALRRRDEIADSLRRGGTTAGHV